jgi:hypothetical protein
VVRLYLDEGDGRPLNEGGKAVWAKLPRCADE